MRAAPHRRGDAPGRREPRGPLHPRARGLHRRPTCSAPRCCSRPRAPRGVKRFLMVSTDEVYGSLGPTGAFTETLAAAALQPVLGLEGRRGPARARLPPHLRAGRGGHPLLEQLRPLPVPREAHPADGGQRAARQAAAGLRRRRQRARLAPRGGPLLGAARSRWRRARPARSTTSAAAPSARTSRSSRASSALLGKPESLIQYVQGPARATTGATPSTPRRSQRELGWTPAHTFEQGLEETVQLVRRQPRLVGARDERRLPAVLRDPVPRAPRAAERAAHARPRHGCQRAGRQPRCARCWQARATRWWAWAAGAQRAARAPTRYVACDLTRRSGRGRARSERRAPRSIIHPASMTEVDACEKDPEPAYAANVTAAAHVAAGARERGRAPGPRLHRLRLRRRARALRRGGPAQPARRLRHHQAHGRAGRARASCPAAPSPAPRWCTAGRRRAAPTSAPGWWARSRRGSR